MKIFVVAATSLELNIIAEYEFETNLDVSFHVHGIGLLESTFKLNHLANQLPDYMIQVGIAGSYNHELKIGETVLVANEQLGDCGAEDHDQLFTLSELNLKDENEFPFKQNLLLNPHLTLLQSQLKKVNGLTVNLCAGKIDTINLRKQKFKADIETMEGAALHYICLQYGIPFLQFRGISNYVEPRNKSNWNISLALASCQEEVIKFIQTIQS